MKRKTWHGPAIWGVFIAADVVLTITWRAWQAPGGPAGALTLAGFVLGIAWAQSGEPG